jgi:laccase
MNDASFLFPERPLILFDYTNISLISGTAVIPLKKTVKNTNLISLKYNTTVEIVLQNTAIIWIESHPMHIHGHENYDVAEAVKGFNLRDPLKRNTTAVPIGTLGGQSSDSPPLTQITLSVPVCLIASIINWHFITDIYAGICLGLANAFEVQNGPTKNDILPSAPPDFPRC